MLHAIYYTMDMKIEKTSERDPRWCPGSSREAPRKHPGCLQQAFKMHKWRVLAAEHHQKGPEAKMKVIFFVKIQIFKPQLVPRRTPRSSQEASRMPPGGFQEALTKHERPVLAAEHHQKGPEANMLINLCKTSHLETPDGPQEHTKMPPGGSKGHP